jgi:UDP-2,3-diacylglucosamine pyrophosphatase LpxH
VPVWSDSIPHFDELYSVSDLHMGGEGTGAQIFNAGSELGLLIRHLRTKPGKVALVLNGDLVDFLAEPNAKSFDPVDANHKLTRIWYDPAFKPVWVALKKFVSTKGRRLVITLGNHDLELALPWVRARLISLLAGEDDATHGRIILAFDGSGFLCRVGNATVLCIHGNEVDDWNVTDYEKIRRVGRDLHQGRSVGTWIPNAGTQLVVEVMNEIKKTYPFVDLLKPELEAVIPVLLAIAPGQRDRIIHSLPALKHLAIDKVRRAAGWLGAGNRTEEIPLTTVPGQLHRPRLNHDSLMAATEEHVLRDAKPISLVRDVEAGEKLGLAEAAWIWAQGGDTREVLRIALDGLQKNRSFDWSHEDDTFRELDEAIGPDVDFILAGHTHLERALNRRKTSGFYFNSGTWARLIKLEPKILADQAEFNKFYGAAAAGTMDALDKFPGLVLRRFTVVAIRAGAEGTRGELMLRNAVGRKPEPVDPEAGMTKT